MARHVTHPAADRRTVLRATGSLTALSLAGCLGSGGAIDDEDVGYSVERVADGFENPWGLAFLPDDGRLLVTERPGRLSLVDPEDGTRSTVQGIPEVHAAGQGGLLDVAVHPEFPGGARVYLTYAATNDAGESATHVGSGQLSLAADDSPALDGFEALHVAEPFVDSDLHFGSRATFGPDGALFVTVGDRRDTNFSPDHVSQDRSVELGSTLRLTSDGDAHPDNLFVDDAEAADAIYSYGHRNPQAMAVRPETGAIWQCEHGEEDGDEINVIERGGNYGWPVASEACRYGTDERVAPSHRERSDVVAPVHYWPCGSGGFPPSGAVFYDGDAFPDWRGDLFAGTLAGRYLGRFTVEGAGATDTAVTEQEPLLSDRDWRIRALAVEPATGHLYVAVDDADAPIARIVPV